MPKIPTFTSEKSITAESSGVVSNIKLSPRSTMASALLPAAREVEAYALKKRDNEEKLEAKKTLLELKAESDKIIESQKDNPNELESILLNIVDQNKHLLNLVTVFFLGVWAYSVSQAYFGAKKFISSKQKKEG